MAERQGDRQTVVLLAVLAIGFLSPFGMLKGRRQRIPSGG